MTHRGVHRRLSQLGRTEPPLAALALFLSQAHNMKAAADYEQSGAPSALLLPNEFAEPIGSADPRRKGGESGWPQTMAVKLDLVEASVVFRSAGRCSPGG
jgi:hypothetical protein